MSYTKLNRSAATLTKNRTEGSVSPFSGMCVTCVDGCIGMCEIGKSAYRGSEVLYPQPFGIITAASEKDYPVDLSHFTVLGTAVGAHGEAWAPPTWPSRTGRVWPSASPSAAAS